MLTYHCILDIIITDGDHHPFQPETCELLDLYGEYSSRYSSYKITQLIESGATTEAEVLGLLREIHVTWQKNNAKEQCRSHNAIHI